MKLFGEYLVEKKLIDRETLLKALLKQLKNTPSLLEVTHEKKLLNEEQLLQVLNQQQKNKVGFIEAAKELKFWNSSIQKTVEDHLSSVRTPLGEILVQMSAIKLDLLTKALDDFLSDLDEKDVAEIKSENSSKNNFFNFFDQLNELLIEKINMNLKPDEKGLIPEKNLNEVKDELYRLCGCAKLVEMNQISNLIQHASDIFVEAGKKDISSLSKDFFDKLSKSQVGLFVFLKEISSNFQSVTNESDAFKSEEVNKKFKQIEDTLVMLKFDLGLNVA